MKFPEQYRWTAAPPPCCSVRGNDYGAFVVPKFMAPRKRTLKIIACAADADADWDHVSVSLFDFPETTPAWAEMCFVKELFWDGEQCVVQFHPPKSKYVNEHPGVLHLWHWPKGFPMPPKECV